MNVRTPKISSPWAQDALVAAIFVALAGLSVVAVLPYLLQLAPAMKIPVSFPVLANAMQAFVLLGLLSFLGLRMGHAVGLGSPLMRSWIQRSVPAWREFRPLHSIALGVLAALAVVAAIRALDPLLPAPLHPIGDVETAPSALTGLFASFYGALR